MKRLVLALLGLAVAVTLGVVLTRGGGGYVVKAEFADAQGLQPNFSVRDQGVVVGQVTAVSVTASDRALVTLRLNSAVAPIGSGATATIEPSDLLGEKYVDLNVGNVDQPQPSGTTIALKQTGSTPELDQVLDAFDPDTRKSAAVFLAEEGDALVGRGRSLGQVLAQLPGSLTSGTRLVSDLGSDNRALGQLIDQSDRILTSAAPQRAALGRLVDNARGALGTLAGREHDLSATITQAPSTLIQLRSTLNALGQAAGPLGQAARGLRNTAPALTATLKAVPAFSTAAIPTLRTAITEAPVLQRLGTTATPIVKALAPTSATLASFASYLAPISKELNGHLNTMLDVAQGWARAISDRDGVGHVYRIEILIPPTTLNTLLGALKVSASRRHELGLLTAKQQPAPTTQTSPATVSTPAPTATTPSSSAPPLSLASLLGTHTSTTPAATTTTPATTTSPNSSLSSLLGYLLGRK